MAKPQRGDEATRGVWPATHAADHCAGFEPKGDRLPPPCATCRHWRVFDHDATKGECWKGTPAEIAGRGLFYPWTYATDFCGEHEPRLIQ